MPRMIRAESLRREYRLDPRKCVAHLSEAIASKQIGPDDWSIRDVAEVFLGEGVVRAMEYRKSGGMLFREAASAVDTTAFSNITGQLIFNKVKDAFDTHADISDQLCTTMKTNFLNGEKVPGVGGLGDEAEIVDEGQPFPEIGLNEEYVEAPRLAKRGFIVSVTREIIVADRTGLLIKRAGEGARYLGINKLKRVMDVAVGATNNYKRNGTSTNTYLTSGAYINNQANPLVDWTDVENAELLFDAITDPNTGEPIAWQGPMTLLVPTALHRTALRIAQATDIRFGDGATNTTATYSPNPLRKSQVTVLTSPYVKARSGSASTWFYGNFRDAFVYSEAWGLETTQAASNAGADFERDIQQRFKVSEMGAAWVYEPRKVTKNT